MFTKQSPASFHPNKILVITLSNIGDAVLTCPAIDIVLRDYPRAKVTLIAGPRSAGLFERNPVFEDVIVYDKHACVARKIDMVQKLRQSEWDLVVDFRDTLLPYLVKMNFRTGPLWGKWTGHMRRKHIVRLATVLDFAEPAPARSICPLDVALPSGSYAIVAPGAADGSKRWPSGHFQQALKELGRNYRGRFIFVGAEGDRAMADEILSGLTDGLSVSMAGGTDLRELAWVVKNADWALTNDSGIMHLASYFSIPTVSMFGPTDPARYGPWGPRTRAISQAQGCLRCLRPGDQKVFHTCMDAIKPEQVVRAVRDLMEVRA